MPIKVAQYIEANGRNRFDDWFRRLEPQTRARIQTRIDRIEFGSFGDYKSVARPSRLEGLQTGEMTMPLQNHRAADYLKTPEDIAAYLNAAIEEMDDDPRLLMKAFRNVAEARGGVSELARQANLDRVALSRALSGRRNPRIDTLAKVAAACAVRLRFSA